MWDRKRHRCIEQFFGLCGRRWGWDDFREQHRNMYIIKCETDRQPRLDAWDKCSGLVHWEDPEGWDGEGVGRGDQDGDTCTPMADSCQCMAKPLQYCNQPPIKINKLKKNCSRTFWSIYMPLYRTGKVRVLVAQSCLTLCDPMDCNLPGLLCPWDHLGKNTGGGSHALLQGIFPTQELNLGLLHCRQIPYHMSHQGTPSKGKGKALIYLFFLLFVSKRDPPSVWLKNLLLAH